VTNGKKVTRGIVEYLAATSLEDFPPEAVQAAKGAIIDCLACMLAGSREPLADVLCDYVRAEGGTPSASVIGRGFKTSTPYAALVNGAMGHALDYDDITEITKTHPTAVLLPGSLALAEEGRASGRELLLAYLVGFEVACSVGAGLSPEYFDDLGWHPTGPLGAIGAGAAAARLLDLDREQTAMAISLAASQAAGLRQNFGTMTKPFHAGEAARSGVTAARLIRQGFTASSDAIEGRFGFMRAFSGGQGFHPEVVLDTLGSKFYMVESGIEVKKYPCCGSAHLALDATLELLSRQVIDPEQVEKIDVQVDFDPPRSLIHPRPTTALEGKFSMQYCLAAALLDHHVGLQSFTEAQISRPAAQSLIPKIQMRRIPGNTGQPSWLEGFHEVAVHLRDGQVLVQRASRSRTGALRGVTMPDILAKFEDCASLVLETETVQELAAQLSSLEDVPDVSQLAGLLRAE
jgi:2-methylcitrate dehydratase PrpD